MKTDHLIYLLPQLIALLKEIRIYSGLSRNVFPKHGDPEGFMSDATLNGLLRRSGYSTTNDITGHCFRGMACTALS